MKLSGTAVIVISLWMILIPISAGTQQNPLPQRTLIVGTKEAPPFSIKTADGQWSGLSIDLWRQIATELNLAFELRELTLKQLLDGVSNRSLDAAVAALTITPEREKIFDFTHTF